MKPLAIKICGVTTPADAELAVDAGATHVGLNFVPSSRRFVDRERAKAIAAAVRGRVVVVGVVADLDDAALLELACEGWLDALQLHGDESADAFNALAFGAAIPLWKAVRVGERGDLARADAYASSLVVDAKVEGELGGTGRRADWELAAELARERPVWLAGGLTPENVAEAVAAVRPFGVDVASGVEMQTAQGPRKDPGRVYAFVAAARAAAAKLTSSG
ncbi:MAG TPA: phosphoribosylanthranilate isomerase [Byssovorax sp.]